MNEKCKQCGRLSKRDVARKYCPVTAKSLTHVPPGNCRFYIDIDDSSSKRPAKGFKNKARRRDVR